MNLFLMLIAMAFTYNSQSNCEKLIGTCEYYLCKDKEVSCQQDNYFYDYGYRNCKILTEPDFLEKLSQDGQDWLLLAMQLLQHETESFTARLAMQFKQDIASQCREVYKESFEIHSSCYRKAGFCELGIMDRFHILNKLKSEVFSWRSWKEFLQLRWGCLRREPLSQEEIELYSRLSEPPRWLKNQAR